MGLLFWPPKADVRALREIDVSPEEFQRTQVRLPCVRARVCTEMLTALFSYTPRISVNKHNLQ